MSSPDPPLVDVSTSPVTSTLDLPRTNQSQGFTNSWSTATNNNNINKPFVFTADSTATQTLSHSSSQGLLFSGRGDPGMSNQPKSSTSTSFSNCAKFGTSRRFPQNLPEEEDVEDVEEEVGEVRQSRKREYPSSWTACHTYRRPNTHRPTFGQSFQAPCFGRDQSQTTNPYSWVVPGGETNGSSSSFSSHAPFSVNNRGDHPFPSNLHRPPPNQSQCQRNSCQYHPPSHNDNEDVRMECEYCETLPPSKSTKFAQFGFPPSLSQNPCHASFNSRCQQHAQNNSAMMEQEAMDTDTISQTSSKSHQPPFVSPATCNANHCTSCSVPGSCQPFNPPCQLQCGCPSRLASHLPPHMQHGLHQSQIKKKVLFIEEINLDGPVGPMTKSCHHLSRGCAGAPCPNDPPPVCLHGNAMSAFRNLSDDDGHPVNECRPCGRSSALNNAYLEGGGLPPPPPRTNPRGILKAQFAARRSSAIALPACQQDESRCRYAAADKTRTPECQSANFVLPRGEATTSGCSRSVNVDPRLPAEDHTKSSNNASSFDSNAGNQDVIFLRTEKR